MGTNKSNKNDIIRMHVKESEFLHTRVDCDSIYNKSNWQIFSTHALEPNYVYSYIFTNTLTSIHKYIVYLI